MKLKRCVYVPCTSMRFSHASIQKRGHNRTWHATHFSCTRCIEVSNTVEACFKRVTTVLLTSMHYVFLDVTRTLWSRSIDRRCNLHMIKSNATGLTYIMRSHE